MNGKRAGRSGLTLLEVLVTMLIVATVVVIISRLQVTTWTSSRTVNNRVRATQIISREIETMRFMISLDTTANFPPRDSSLTDEVTGLPVRWTVSTPSDPWGAAVPKVRQVRFAVNWTVPRLDSVTVVTMISQEF